MESISGSDPNQNTINPSSQIDQSVSNQTDSAKDPAMTNNNDLSIGAANTDVINNSNASNNVLSNDNNNATTISDGTGTSVDAMPIETSASNTDKIGVKACNDVRYQKYFKMTQFGVPLQAVKLKMEADGNDSSILE